jgi:hypothetical protein
MSTTRGVSRTTRGMCGPVLLLGGTHPPKNHAASARPSYAVLSFAFTFSGTLPINQSRTALFRPSRS